jgi:Tol biopolymer transport system component
MAAPFDLDRLAVTGPLVRVTEPRMQSQTAEAWVGEWDFADDGTLVFATATAATARGREAVWIDRSGNETTLAMHPVADGDWARLSPDGTRVVYGALDQGGNWDIYLYTMADGSDRRLTFDPAFDSRPIFHPDGRRVLFSALRNGARQVFELDLTHGGPHALSEEILGFPRSLSANGDLLFFDRAVAEAFREDIGVFSRSQGRTSLLLESEAAERYPSLSPDGHWLAYESDASGRSEVYVQPVPAFDATHQVSTEGGNFPVWSAGGDRLYYRQGRALIAATIDTSDGFAVAAREPLFESPFDVDNHYFDVAPDGEHFLLLRPPVGGVSELVVVDSWFGELDRLVPTD